MGADFALLASSPHFFFFANDVVVTITISGEDIDNIWVQQKGAMCHTAHDTIDILLTIYENRIISIKLFSLGLKIELR